MAQSPPPANPWNCPGTTDAPVRFASADYLANAPLDATYTFNSYRATYRYRFHAGERTTAWVRVHGEGARRADRPRAREYLEPEGRPLVSEVYSFEWLQYAAASVVVRW